MQVKHVLNEGYSIKEAYVLDNHLCKFNENIKPIPVLKSIDSEEYTIILACLDVNICREIEKDIYLYSKNPDILYLESVKDKIEQKDKTENGVEKDDWRQINRPVVGKYSFGSLCSNCLVESIGAF